MPTSFVDVTGGMNPLQAQQSLNAAQTGTRDQIDWANKQALRNIQSKHTNDDGSMDQFGFIHEAAAAGIGPDAVKAWLSNQNDTNAAASNQANTNYLLNLYNLDPNALRDQSKLPGTPGAGQNNTIDGQPLAPGQSIQYNNAQGAGAPVGKSTLDVDALPGTSDEVRARAAARAQNGAVPQPTDLDTQTNAMGARASAWGKGSPTTAAIQKQIGLTGSDVDGTWGPKTAAAYKAYLANNPKAGVVQAGNKLQFLQDAGASAFAPSQPTSAPSASSASSASVFAPKPITGAKAMTAGPTDVIVNGKNEEANDGGTFTAPAPEDDSHTITSTQDRRSILERLADSGSGTPTMPTTQSSDDNTNYFNYGNVVKTGGLNLKAGIDATLSKFGKSRDQAGVNAVLDQAAAGVPKPVPQIKDGKPDPTGTLQAQQDYQAKVAAAKTAAAKALADGNTTALAEILTQKKYAGIEVPAAKRAADLYAAKAETVQTIKNKGYVGVNQDNVSEYQKIDASLEEARGVVKSAKTLVHDIKTNPTMDRDQLAVKTATFLHKMLSSDDVNTVGAADAILNSLGSPPSLREQLHNTVINSIEDLPYDAANFFRKVLTTNGPNKFAGLIDEMANGIITNGKAGSDARAYGLKRPFGAYEQGPTGAGAFTPKPRTGSTQSRKPNRSTAGM